MLIEKIEIMSRRAVAADNVIEELLSWGAFVDVGDHDVTAGPKDALDLPHD